MKSMILTFCASLLLALPVIAQEPVFPVTNYITKDYGRDFHPANLAIAQDSRGMIYAANGFKLMEFDGNSWKSYPINKETWILSLAIGNSGIVYAGSQNEFGFFAPDSKGELKYNSISDSLKIIDTDFTNIWKVHSFSGGIVFQAEEKIFIYRKGKIEVISPETSFHTSFIVNDILYVRQRGKGLMQLKNSTLVRIKGSEIFDTTGVFLMLPFGSNSKKILVGTQEKGLWIYEPGNISTPFCQFKVDNLPMLQKAKITGGVLTGNKSFAISTMLNGIIILDTTGTVKSIVNKKCGLTDNDIKQVISDKCDNLWLAANNGISTIELSSPLSLFNEKSGIPGSINALKRYRNLLYTGTSEGLYVQQTKNESDNQFITVPGLSSQVWSLAEANGKLLAGTNTGIFQFSGKNFVKISNEESYTLFYSPEKKLLFSGGPKGVSVYSDEGLFKKLNCLNDIHEDIISITGNKIATSDSAEYWIGTRNNGVIRLKYFKNLIFKTDHYTSSDGLPGGPVTPFIYDSNTLFATIEGLYEFNSESVVKESLPDSLKNNKDFLKGFFSATSLTNDSVRKSVSSLAESSSKIWICSDNKIGYLDKKSNPGYISKPFQGIDVGKINLIYPEENGICWFGTTDGLIRFDENTMKNYNTEFFSLVRKVTLMDTDSSIFMGTNFKTDSVLNISIAQPDILKPVLPYKNNSIRLEFAAPFFEYPNNILYSYQLEGNNSKWSPWKKENYQEFTNLREGNYNFRIKARNIYGIESIPSQYSFSVLPPWYRSFAAYVLYLVSAIVLVWLIVRLYSYRLKLENIRLEGIVTERTLEVVRQKDEIENKNIVLEYQKKEIEDSIRYARRIQSAVIPSEEDCINLLHECFVFFRPLNIVSGDFYWIGQVENKIIFTAADCTGHGVPGAIMSMLGVAFLNEIVTKDHVTEPGSILNHLRNKVIEALQQHGVSGEARDGMDIAIICLDKQQMKLQYAGAYNPLVLIRNNEIIETRGDKMPVGIYENMIPFKGHEIAIEKGDVLYMASDGYEDQFGGAEGKKFKAKNFKEMLLEIHNYPMKEQKAIVERRFDEWKGDLSQIDDIVVTGIRL
jgi:serine phosphatase RsbU (regulator of sigma subunit)/ligand-binding sensor domain-containing protein